MNANRALAVVRRLPAAAKPFVVQQARLASHSAGEEHGHDDHHHVHLTFEPPYNPFGAPLAIYVFLVFGGLGTVYGAFTWSMSGWKKPA